MDSFLTLAYSERNGSSPSIDFKARAMLASVRPFLEML